ncbi:hypothetical protein [Flagellimonas sp.]
MKTREIKESNVVQDGGCCGPTQQVRETASTSCCGGTLQEVGGGCC